MDLPLLPVELRVVLMVEQPVERISFVVEIVVAVIAIEHTKAIAIAVVAVEVAGTTVGMLVVGPVVGLGRDCLNLR